MGIYEKRILPRCFAWAMGRKRFHRHRAHCLAGLSGNVLEVGGGAGHNLDFYPGAVTEVLALEPS